MSLKPLTVHWKGEGPQTYYPTRGCIGFSKVTVEADEYRVNQLPWEYRKKFTLTEEGEYILKADNDNTFLYEPVVNVDVGKHIYDEYRLELYPKVNPNDSNMASFPTEVQEEYDIVVDIADKQKEDPKALGFKRVRIHMQPDQRVPVHYLKAYDLNKRMKKQITDTEIVWAHPFEGSYTDAYGNDGLINLCNSYYNGFKITTDVTIPITSINKVPIHDYHKDLLPIMTLYRGECAILITWEWKEWLNADPEWIVRAVFVGDEEGFVETIHTNGWAVTRAPYGHRMDREIRVAGMGDRTLACTTSSVDKGTSQVFELRLDHDAFEMNLGSPLDPIIPGSIDEMLGRVPAERSTKPDVSVEGNE